MVVEDRLCSIGGELRRERRCLLATPLAVVLTPHRVGPAVPVRDLQPETVLVEDLLEVLPIGRPRVCQRLVDQIAEGLLEAAGLELFPAQLPVGLWTCGVGVGVVTSLDEQFVVELMQTPRPAGVLLQRLTGALIVVDHVDVSVDVLSLGIAVDDDEVLGAVGSLSQADAQAEHLLDVLGVTHIEHLRVPSEHEVVGLVPAAVGSSHLFGVGDELLGGTHRRRIGHRTVRAVLHVLDVLPATSVERIHDTAAAGDASGDVHRRAHVLVRSPSAARRAVTAASVRSKSSPSTTTVTVSPALRAVAASRRRPLSVMPSRRSCSTSAAVAASGRGRTAARSMRATSSRLPSSASRRTARAHALGLTPSAFARRLTASRSARETRTSRCESSVSREVSAPAAMLVEAGTETRASRDLVRQLRFARRRQDPPALVLGRCAPCGRGEDRRAARSVVRDHPSHGYITSSRCSSATGSPVAGSSAPVTPDALALRERSAFSASRAARASSARRP